MAQFPATEIPREHRPPVDEHGTAPDGADAVRSSAATAVASECGGSMPAAGVASVDGNPPARRARAETACRLGAKHDSAARRETPGVKESA